MAWIVQLTFPCAVLSHSVVSKSLQPHGLQPSRILCPWQFSRQEYWRTLPCPPPGDCPNPGIKPRSSALQADSLLLSHTHTHTHTFVVVQSISHVWLCNLMDNIMPGSSVLHYLPEFAQIHVHWVGDAVQPSYPLLPPSLFAVNLSQHQGLFQWISSSHQVARVLKVQLQHQSFQWIFRVDFLLDGLVGSPCCSRDSQESSAPQFKSISSSALSLPYGLTLTVVHDFTGKTIALTMGTFVNKWCLCFLILCLGLV